jgi:hypothetical protein
LRIKKFKNLRESVGAKRKLGSNKMVKELVGASRKNRKLSLHWPSNMKAIPQLATTLVCSCNYMADFNWHALGFESRIELSLECWLDHAADKEPGLR